MAYFRRNKVISPQRKYMEQIYAMDAIFGSTFFRCTQHCSRALPDVVQLGNILHRTVLVTSPCCSFTKLFPC